MRHVFSLENMFHFVFCFVFPNELIIFQITCTFHNTWVFFSKFLWIFIILYLVREKINFFKRQDLTAVSSDFCLFRISASLHLMRNNETSSSLNLNIIARKFPTRKTKKTFWKGEWILQRETNNLYLEAKSKQLFLRDKWRILWFQKMLLNLKTVLSNLKRVS